MPDAGHLDPEGRLRMVDVGHKRPSHRRAVARCELRMRPETLAAITAGPTPKGDVLAVAQVAGVQAAKRTPELIPGCHPLRISAVEIRFEVGDGALEVEADVRGEDRTGFEMEALTACAVAALTVYDMIKGVDPHVRIEGLHLAAKEGGKSSHPVDLTGVRAAVLTVSDAASAGDREDRSGPQAREWLEAAGAAVVTAAVVPDDRERVAAAIRELAGGSELVVTTGGTGVGPRDVTPEATLDVVERTVPGLAETIRAESLRVTPNAMLSRGASGIVGSTLVVNLPGSPKAVLEALDAIGPALGHAVDLVRGGRPH